jgi:hypothetical protein
MTSAQEVTLPPWFDQPSWQTRIAQQGGSRAWFCEWVIQRVEAAVGVYTQAPLEQLPRAMLLRIALEHRLPSDQEAVDAQLVAGLRLDLLGAGLIAETSPEQWELTEGGARALESGTYLKKDLQRRLFHFLPRAGGPLPALFLPIVGEQLATSSRAPFMFEPDWVRSCVALPLEQKRILHFPEDIHTVETAPPGAAPDWRRVVLGSAREGYFVLVELAGDGGATSLSGHLIEPSDIPAGLDRPAFVLGPGWQQFLPDLNQGPAGSGPLHQPVKRIFPRGPDTYRSGIG